MRDVDGGDVEFGQKPERVDEDEEFDPLSNMSIPIVELLAKSTHLVSELITYPLLGLILPSPWYGRAVPSLCAEDIVVVPHGNGVDSAGPTPMSAGIEKKVEPGKGGIAGGCTMCGIKFFFTCLLMLSQFAGASLRNSG